MRMGQSVHVYVCQTTLRTTFVVDALERQSIVVSKTAFTSDFGQTPPELYTKTLGTPHFLITTQKNGFAYVRMNSFLNCALALAFRRHKDDDCSFSCFGDLVAQMSYFG